MSIKKILLSTVFLCGSMMPVQQPEIIDYFFCNAPKLRALEEQKFAALAKGLNTKSVALTEQEQQQIDMQTQALFLRLLLVYQKYAELFQGSGVEAELDPQAKAICAKYLLSQYASEIQQDQELTTLVKNLAGFVCKILCLSIDKVVFSKHFEKIKSGTISQADIAELFANYFPKNMDVVQIGMEYIVWNHAYLKKQLDAKKALTIDDLCYSVQQFGVIAKLPKKTQELWNDLVLAVQKGMKDLPQDMCREMLKTVEDSLRKSELEMGIKLLTSLAKLRSEIVATRCADQGKLIGYGKLMDQFIAQIHKAQKQTVVTKNQTVKGIMIVEKLIFKN